MFPTACQKTPKDTFKLKIYFRVTKTIKSDLLPVRGLKSNWVLISNCLFKSLFVIVNVSFQNQFGCDSKT